MEKGARVFVAGHRGLVGSAITRRLEKGGFTDIVKKTKKELDLTRQADVERFFAEARPAYVFLAAAKVGGILANDTMKGDFIRENLQIQTNVIDAAYRNGTQKLLFIGSSCIYPKMAPQPIREESLLSGPLEPTNDAYAIAKIAGIKMIEAYRKQYGFHGICAQPTNLYGPGDSFDPKHSHVLPALIRKFHEAKVRGDKTVTIWGTGTPRREFLHVDDLADACVHLMETYDSSDIVNIGCGDDIAIKDLALLVQKVVGFTGDLTFDTTKPDGTPRKLLDVSRLKALGWKRELIPLEDGIRAAYAWFVENVT